MKKSTKIALMGGLLLIGATALSGCTASFCSTNDKAHILYMFDYGISEYHNISNNNEYIAVRGFENLFAAINVPEDSASGIVKANAAADKAQIDKPTNKFFVEFDTTVLQHATLAFYKEKNPTQNVATFKDIPSTFTSNIVAVEFKDGVFEDAPQGKISVQEILDKYGYLKYADSVPETHKNKEILWTNYDSYLVETKNLITETNAVLNIDDLPSKDYVKLYKTSMNNQVANYRSCLAISTDKYGYYGFGSRRGKVEIEGKSWDFAWKKGLLEGLLIYPISWLTDTLVNAFKFAGPGWAQILAIVVITLIVRGLMLLVTIRSTQANAKMQALQPESTKIQNKYPNANTNQYEKQRMADEMQKLYKKNNINPLSTIVTLIVQFPVFICIWGALQGAASLSSDEFLGLNLSLTIREVLFNGTAWTAKGGYGAVTALILFILMSATQVFSMLIPQWTQKRANKNVAKLGKNPAKKEQDNKTKWFTYIMMAMIIIMGFSLASAMGVYWLVSAVFAMIQTLITTKITNSKKDKR